MLISRSFGNWFCFLLQAKGIAGRSYSEKHVMIEAVPMIMKYQVTKRYKGVKDMPTFLKDSFSSKWIHRIPTTHRNSTEGLGEDQIMSGYGLREENVLPCRGIKPLSAISSSQPGYYTNRLGQCAFPKMKVRECLMHAEQTIYTSDYLVFCSSQLLCVSSRISTNVKVK